MAFLQFLYNLYYKLIGFLYYLYNFFMPIKKAEKFLVFQDFPPPILFFKLEFLSKISQAAFSKTAALNAGSTRNSNIFILLSSLFIYYISCSADRKTFAAHFKKRIFIIFRCFSSQQARFPGCSFISRRNMHRCNGTIP